MTRLKEYWDILVETINPPYYIDEQGNICDRATNLYWEYFTEEAIEEKPKKLLGPKPSKYKAKPEEFFPAPPLMTEEELKQKYLNIVFSDRQKDIVSVAVIAKKNLGNGYQNEKVTHTVNINNNIATVRIDRDTEEVIVRASTPKGEFMINMPVDRHTSMVSIPYHHFHDISPRIDGDGIIDTKREIQEYHAKVQTDVENQIRGNRDKDLWLNLAGVQVADISRVGFIKPNIE